jgi:G:T/U-mismatch repair DNA glycosylase
MLPEIWAQNLRIVFVGAFVPAISDDLGFYYLTPNNRFWFLLEYAGLAPVSVVSASERSTLLNAHKDRVLDEMYKKLFFERKEDILLKHHLGLTDLNRRRVFSKEDDPAAVPTADDLQKFIKKVEKYKPRIVAFVIKPEIFERCFKTISPAASRDTGKQNIRIGSSEVWLLGSTSGRVKDADPMEQLFEDLSGRLIALEKEGG